VRTRDARSGRQRHPQAEISLYDPFASLPLAES
jgi:hypothetical protein